MAAKDKHATIEELLEAVYSLSQLRSAVAEVGNSSRTQMKRNFRRWKPLLSSAVKTVTENTSPRGTVIFKM
jgi:hypothetical protein